MENNLIFNQDYAFVKKYPPYSIFNNVSQHSYMFPSAIFPAAEQMEFVACKEALFGALEEIGINL